VKDTVGTGVVGKRWSSRDGSVGQGHERGGEDRRSDRAVEREDERRASVDGSGRIVLDALRATERPEVADPSEAERDAEPATDLLERHERAGKDRPDRDPRPGGRPRKDERDRQTDREHQLDQAEAPPLGDLVRSDVASAGAIRA
jgi:hypothetical protein